MNRAPKQLTATEIEQLTGRPVENSQELELISGLSTLDVPEDRCLIFRDHFAEEDVDTINAFAGRSTLFALPEEYRGLVRVPAIFLDRPREAFIALAVALYDYYGQYWQGFEDSAVAQARHRGATLMPGCHIHATAQIGAESIVFPGVVIGPNVQIGRHALIKANSVVGLPGFGIHVSSDKKNMHLPHVGGVIIGDDVELGALNTVCAGTVHPTIVCENVKTDDQVHIAHNVVVGRSAQITAQVELSGSVAVGEHVFLGPNCSVANSVSIGAGAIVGIGSAVLKDVPPSKLVVGNPSRVLRDLDD